MPKFELQRLPGAPKERGAIAAGTPLVEWLNGQRLHNCVVIKLNGRELADDFDISYPLRDRDVVHVFDQPEGGVGNLITSVLRPVTKILSTSLKWLGGAQKTSSPSISTGESPNNDLTQQTNRARLYRGRPNSYGLTRIYPDLIQESGYEFADNKKQVFEWMNAGIGRGIISSVRYSESSLIALAGGSYRVYQPGEVIPEIPQPYAFDDVDGQEIPGRNEDSEEIRQQATTDSLLSGIFGGGQFHARILKNNDFDGIYDSPRPLAVAVTVNVSYNTASGPVTKDAKINASLFNATITDDGAEINPEQYYNFYFDTLSGADYDALPADTIVNSTLFTITEYETIVIGPFFAALESEQLWIHLYANLGKRYDAPARVTLWAVDSDNNAIAGTEETVDIEVHNPTGGQKYIYVTKKITPAAGVQRYAFRIERTNNSQSDSVLYIHGAQAVTVRRDVVYPDDTIIMVSRRETENPTALSDPKYNCLWQRMTISWTPEGGIDYTLRASRSFADAALHEWVVVSKQDPERLDLAALYAIADSLPDPRLGYFDWTFSDEKQSLGERIQTICNAARVSGNQIGDMLTFWRDERVDYPDAVFARSNMFWEDYKVEYTMSLPGGYDGVTLDYTDPVTNKKSYIYLRVDENGIAEVPDATINAQQISLSGCRNAVQANDKAWLEARRMLHSRITMTARVLESTQVVRGSVVQCPDMYDNRQQTGYLRGRDGDMFLTSERIEFDGDMWVVMSDSAGDFRGRWRAQRVEGNPRAFTANAEEFDINIYDGKHTQSPSRYFIATDSELNSTLWRVDSAKPNGDETQTLTLTEYSDEIYQ
ncbi:host specificity factor TipJ family phage tail protein [Entomohabitans teleogrylli]|uniref:host specificity factor TipJ family phage tail protein n=1 Tax=Entomohabitans teleogrylli TaxID=1384589 RepID=UPI00073D8409|nr:host specificity factor TipJ family phage tail protein [Entomohabitans teleogrylli]